MVTKIPPDVIQDLKNRYGTDRLRLVAQLYGANIPERYWMNDYDKDVELLKSVVVGMRKQKDYFIACSDMYVSNLFVSTILKQFLKQGHDSIKFGYSELISKYSDKFGVFNLDALLTDMEMFKLIAITDVVAGKFYDQTKHHLENILTNLINSRIHKNILVNVIEYEGVDQNSYKATYGEFISDLMFGGNFETVSGLK